MKIPKKPLFSIFLLRQVQILSLSIEKESKKIFCSLASIACNAIARKTDLLLFVFVANL